MANPLYKTTIVIYSPYPGDQIDLSDLARDAETGDSICTECNSEPVERDDLPGEAALFLVGDEDET